MAQSIDKHNDLQEHVGKESTLGSDPLTASAAVEAIRRTSDRIIETIANTIGNSGAAQTWTELQVELNSTGIIVSSLETFLRCTNDVAPARASIIPVQDVISVMTQLTLVCSELRPVIEQWQESQSFIEHHPRKARTKPPAAITRLQDRLRRHKLSASLVLQIISCASQSDAEHVADALRSRIDQDIGENLDLANRLQQLRLPLNVGVIDDSHRPLSKPTEGEILLQPGIEQPLPTNENGGPQSDAVHRDTVPQDSLNESAASSQTHETTQTNDISTLTTARSTRSHGWSVLSDICCTRLTTVGAIHLPLQTSEIRRLWGENCIQRYSDSTKLARSDLQATWTYLEENLEEIMRDSGATMSMKTFVSIYTRVHDACTPGKTTYSEEIYVLLNSYLSAHVKKLRAISDTYTGESFLSFYAGQWERYAAAAKKIDHLFRSMNRQWVKREIDEGRKDLYDAYTLHLVIWKSEFFDSTGERLTNVLLHSIHKLRDGQTIEHHATKIVVESLVILGSDHVDDTFYIYRRYFEQPFLSATREYYQQESKQYVAGNSIAEYMKIVELKLNEERDQVGLFLQAVTVKKMMEICNETLINDHMTFFQNGFQLLLEEARTENLRRMYNLLSQTHDGLGLLKEGFDDYFGKAGPEINSG